MACCWPHGWDKINNEDSSEDIEEIEDYIEQDRDFEVLLHAKGVKEEGRTVLKITSVSKAIHIDYACQHAVPCRFMV